MDKQEVVEMCLECPLYFTMPLRTRLEFVKKREQWCSPNELREALLHWVKTGHFFRPDENIV